MPYTFDLTRQVLADLRRPRKYPAFSLLLPTHRRDPGKDQDAIRLRNLLTEAKKRLAADPEVDRDTRIDVERQLDAAAADLDLNRATEGALLLAAPGEHQTWNLPTTVPEAIVVADTFLTRNLVASHAHEAPYWVLVISEQRSRLLHGAGASMAEVTGHGFPFDPEIPSAADADLGENFGQRPGNYREERLRQYLRALDDALFDVLKTGNGPVHLVGLENVLHILEGLTRNADRFGVRVPRGGAEKDSVPELEELLVPAREEYAAQQEQAVLDRLQSSIGQRRFAAGLDEVWQAVTEGRAQTVVVEDRFRAVAKLENGHLVPAGPDDREAQDDVVDSLVEQALDTDAEVRFVADDTLEQHGRVAAVLRY